MPRHPARIALTLLAGAALTLTGCADEDHGSTQDVTIVGDWLPAEVPAQELSPGYRPESSPIEFAEDGRWHARDGCHPVSGRYALDGDAFTAEGPRNDVRARCLVGVRYDEILTQATRVAREGDEVSFYDGDTALLTLAAAERAGD